MVCDWFVCLLSRRPTPWHHCHQLSRLQLSTHPDPAAVSLCLAAASRCSQASRFFFTFPSCFLLGFLRISFCQHACFCFFFFLLPCLFLILLPNSHISLLPTFTCVAFIYFQFPPFVPPTSHFPLLLAFTQTNYKLYPPPTLHMNHP